MGERDEEFDEELIDTGDAAGEQEDDEEREGFGDEDDEGEDDEDDDVDDVDDVDDFGEEDDEDDEGEPAEFRAALLAKQEMIALLSLRTAAGGGRIVRIDPRQPLPAAKSYEDPAEAARWFRRSLLTSQRNGWRVVYDGEPLFG